MERITYTLAFPIETIDRSDGTERATTITTLMLAPRIKGRHMKATDKAGGMVEAKLLLISSLAGISRAEADELDERDVIAIDALYDEESDLAVIAAALELPRGASIDEIRAAIGRIMAAKGLTVPLDGGAGRSADGQATGPGLSET